MAITEQKDIDLVTKVLAEYSSASLKQAEKAVETAQLDVERAHDELIKARQRLDHAEQVLLMECIDLRESEIEAGRWED